MHGSRQSHCRLQMSGSRQLGCRFHMSGSRQPLSTSDSTIHQVLFTVKSATGMPTSVEMKSANPLQTSSLFKIFIEVSTVVVEFVKCTPVSAKHVKSASGLSTSNLPCTVNLELKSANPLPTMNSVPKILKLTFGSLTLTLPCMDKNKNWSQH